MDGVPAVGQMRRQAVEFGSGGRQTLAVEVEGGRQSFAVRDGSEGDLVLVQRQADVRPQRVVLDRG